MAKVGTSNVKVQEIGSILNAAGGSVDVNKPATYFSTNAKLNMWSRYKPMVINLNFVDLWDKRDATKYYYQGSDGMCGLNIPEFTSPSAFKAALIDGSYKWLYRLPVGTEDEPLRLGDFRRYNTDAQCPIGEIGELILKDDYSIDINVDVGVSDAAYNLTLSDFVLHDIKMSDMYLGAYLYQSASRYRFSTSPTPIGNQESISFTVKADSNFTGKFKVFAFLSTLSQANGEQSGGWFYGLPIENNGNEVEIKPAGSGLTYFCGGSYEQGLGWYEVYVEVNNKKDYTEVISELYIGFQVSMDYGKTWQNAGSSTEVTMGKNISISPKSVWTETKSGTRTAFNENYQYRCYLTDGASILATGMLEDVYVPEGGGDEEAPED